MTQHIPIEVPVGPWECIDRACEEYEDTDGNDRPEVAYCSHVTVLILCEACCGWTEQHGVKNESTWADCILRDEMRRAAAKLRDAGPYIPGKIHRYARPVSGILEAAAGFTYPMTPSQRHLWDVAAVTAVATNSREAP